MGGPAASWTAQAPYFLSYSGDLMARIYTTREGETVDLACLSHYGRTAAVVEAVLSANPGLSSLGPILPLGTQIIMPDMPSVSAERRLIGLWD